MTRTHPKGWRRPEGPVAEAWRNFRHACRKLLVKLAAGRGEASSVPRKGGRKSNVNVSPTSVVRAALRTAQIPYLASVNRPSRASRGSQKLVGLLILYLLNTLFRDDPS